MIKFRRRDKITGMGSATGTLESIADRIRLLRHCQFITLAVLYALMILSVVAWSVTGWERRGVAWVIEAEIIGLLAIGAHSLLGVRALRLEQQLSAGVAQIAADDAKSLVLVMTTVNRRCRAVAVFGGVLVVVTFVIDLWLVYARGLPERLISDLPFDILVLGIAIQQIQSKVQFGLREDVAK